jgi:8-oxo-dGTP diphosphatase
MRQAGVMLLVKDGLILAISRRENKALFGLPGGKAEPEETPMQAAIRETSEETGVTVKECIWIYTRDEPRNTPQGEDFECHCFFATDWSGEPYNSEEGEVKWLTAEELTSTKAAFGSYNKNTLNIFAGMFPDVKLQGE